MLIPRRALCTLIAGAHAAESIERSPPTVEVNGTRSPLPILLSARTALSRQDGQRNESSQDEGQLGGVKSELPAVKDDGLEARQAAPVRPPTVFSTSYITSTITNYVGEPVTTTIFETFTTTASIALQKRTIPWPSSSNEIPAHLDDVLRTSDDPPKSSDRKKRQNNLSTITSVIYMISRTVVTVAPTISTTIPVTVTIATASDGSTTTLSPSTTSSLPSTTASLSQSSASKTSLQSTQTSLPTGTPTTSSLNQGAIAGGVLGSLFAGALLLTLILCCVRRRRKKRNPTKAINSRDPGYTTTITSSSSLDRDEGTLIHHENFHVGASPPASEAPSASEQQEKQYHHQHYHQQPVDTTPPPPVLQMKQVLPAIDDTSCELQQPGDLTRRQSNRAGRIWLVNNDSDEEEKKKQMVKESSGSNSNSSNRNSSSGSGTDFDSNEAQPPSPVASSDIFGPYNSTYRHTRDTWATSTDMSLSFASPRNLTMLGSDFDDDENYPSRMSESMEHAMWHGDDDDVDDDDEEEDQQQSDGDLWAPSIPERSKRRSQTKRPGEKAVRFQETPTTPTRRKSSGSGGRERVDGSSAFL